MSFIGWTLFIIALIGVCTYIARTKLNAAGGALRDMENSLKTTNTGSIGGDNKRD